MLPSTLQRSCFAGRAVLAAVLLLCAGLSVAGCSGGSSNPPTNTTPPPPLVADGGVFSGQHPVSGANVILYAVGTTGIGSAASSLLTATVVTDASGKFHISGLFHCNAGDQVYLVAAGGDAGGGQNRALALLSAAGSCSALAAAGDTVFITINEVTTVASVSALSAFINGPANLGDDAASANALGAAMANVQTLVNVATGAGLVTAPGNGVVPLATLNSLANSVAACAGATASSASCTGLFAAATVSGAIPENTLDAVINLVHNPAHDAAQIFALAGSATPFQPTLTSAPASYALRVAHPSDALTYHGDNSRDGVQSAESLLTPANVSSAKFGKLFTFPVDSYLYAQPLYVGGVGMPDGAIHNLVLTATTRGTVTMFDADGNNPASGYLWQRSLLPAGDRFPTSSDFGCRDIQEAAIVGTPVIDRDAQTIYVVVKSITSTGNTFSQKLHAISLIDGTEQANSPQLVAPTFSGSGAGASNNLIAFNAQRQLNRSALTLVPSSGGDKTVLIAWGSHCDIGPYHGIVLGYNAANIAQLTASFNDTPNGSDGGIWMAGGGLAADAQGSLYALAGNGSFDANTGGADYADSALKFAVPAPGAASTRITVSDSFTPSNQAALQSGDEDLGGAEGLLFSDSGRQYLVASDKKGEIFLLDTASMGGYDTGTHGPMGLNGDVQDFVGGGKFIYNFAYFNRVLYTSNPVRAYTFNPGSGSAPGQFASSPVAALSISYAAPVVSAQGTANAIVWMLDQSDILHAYTPDLTEIYNSAQAASNRDQPAPLVKFTSPVIANGKVYVSGAGALVVYGPLP